MAASPSRPTSPGVKVSWLVIGVRRDPYALGNPLQVEAAKSGAEVGRYLYPQGYGLRR